MKEKDVFFACLALLISVSTLTNSGFAVNYSYNMTQDEKEQFNLSALCYEMKSDLTIEALDDFCKLSYGDLDSNYGDKFNATKD